jgi:RecB family exonuclease
MGAEKQWYMSPSQFEQAKQCSYRYLLKVTNAPALPPSGAAVLGLVMHGMLEVHGYKPFVSIAEFDAEWQYQVSKQEEQLISHPVTAALVPLEQTVRNYAVKRVILRRSIVGSVLTKKTVCTTDSVTETKPNKAKAKLGIEIPLVAGRIAGRADLIRQCADGVEIVDYKTGQYAVSGVDFLPIAKPEYARQLQLYAALYHAETTVWPVRGLLLGLAGGKVEVSFVPDECLSVLSEANRLLNELEQAVHLGTSSELARPALGTCRFCSYRPDCRSYLALLNDAGGVLGTDVLGVLGKVVAKNNRLNLTVTTPTGPVIIQAAGKVASRLTEEAIAGNGQNAVLYGVQQTPGSRTFTAGPTAVICLI